MSVFKPGANPTPPNIESHATLTRDQIKLIEYSLRKGDFDALSEFTPEQLHTQEAKEAVYSMLVLHLTRGDINIAKKIIAFGFLDENEIKTVILTAFEMSLEDAELSHALNIVELGILDKTDLKKEEIKNKAQYALRIYLTIGLIDNIKAIINFGILNEYEIKTEANKMAVKKGLAQKISVAHHTDDAKEIINLGFLDEAEIKSTMEEGLITCFLKGYPIDGAKKIISWGYLNKAELKSEKIRAAAKDRFTFVLALQTLEQAKDMVDLGILNDDEVKIEVQNTLVICLYKNFASKVKDIIDWGILSDAEIKTPEIKTAAQEIIIQTLTAGEITNIDKIIQSGILSEVELKSEKLKHAAQIGLITNFRVAYASGAKKIIGFEILDESDIKTEEIKVAALRVLKQYLSIGQTTGAKEIIGLEIVDIDDIKNALQEQLSKNLSAGSVVAAKKIIDLGILDEAELKLNKAAAKKGLIMVLSIDTIDSIQTMVGFGILDENDIKSEGIKSATSLRLRKTLISGQEEEFKKLTALGILDEAELKTVVQESLTSTLFIGNIDAAKMIISSLSLDKTQIQTVENIAAVQSRLLELLQKGDMDGAKKIIDLGILNETEKERVEKISHLAKYFSLAGPEYTVLTQKTNDELSELKQNIQAKNQTTAEQLSAEIHNQAIKTYDDTNDKLGVVRDGLGVLKNYIDNDKIIWKFLGQSNRHDSLQNVSYFTSVIYLDSDPEKTKKLAIAMFERAGMGTGMQRDILVEIMGKMTYPLWKKLQSESVIKGQQPPLSDPNNINLSRVRKEMRMLQMPEFIKAVNEISDENEELRQYALALIDHPTVNIDAVRNFIEKPDKFFASRTGAAEDNPIINNTLTALSPEYSPGNWTAADARDAIVDGTYDRLNAFSPLEVTFTPKNTIDQSIYTEVQTDGSWPIIANVADFVEKNNELREIVDFHMLAARGELFLSLLSNLSEEEKNHATEHITNKGDAIIDKAVAYLIKRKKMSPEEKEHMLQKLSDAKNNALKENNPASFWEEIYLTGWLNNADIKTIYKNISGNDNFKDEGELLANSATSETGKRIVAQRSQKLKNSIDESRADTFITFAILAPSNIEAATAGSTTGNCDAFGHGKKAHFMINPAAAQLMIYEQKKGSADRKVIGQSTVVDGKSIWNNARQRQAFFDKLSSTGKITNALKESGENNETLLKKLQSLLEDYSKANRIITLDSLEVPPNIQKTRYNPKQMFNLCQEGFKRLGQIDPHYNATVQVGTQYSYFDEASGLITHPNLDISTAPLAYTDNNGAKSVLVQEGEVHLKEDEGVRKLKPIDAFSVALMEEIAFRRTNGENYVTGYLPITQEVWTSTVEAAHRQHAPLSYISHNEQGVPNGYLIAYTKSKKEIYITDTATTGTEKGVGGSLLFTLMGAVAKDKKLNQMAITMDCRGATSALAIAKNKDSLQEMEFDNDEGVPVKYAVEGPNTADIRGDNLYQFKFIIKK